MPCESQKLWLKIKPLTQLLKQLWELESLEAGTALSQPLGIKFRRDCGINPKLEAWGEIEREREREREREPEPFWLKSSLRSLGATVSGTSTGGLFRLPGGGGNPDSWGGLSLRPQYLPAKAASGGAKAAFCRSVCTIREGVLA